MDRRPDITEQTPSPLLALVGHDGEALGTTLLRLAHRAAAQHRLEAALQHQQRASNRAHIADRDGVSGLGLGGASR